ncbi:C6 transcription factor [Fusarium pseudoanthophilum]|uniref:C6 transcription factor n=1 Tax=Fusarium pseudoanthophilum TaxID=48495 RepID=A0A8H5KJG7_9HYPO|nr:C6 transcription factor [Fusarium pseudoanthophilum]
MHPIPEHTDSKHDIESGTTDATRLRALQTQKNEMRWAKTKSSAKTRRTKTHKRGAEELTQSMRSNEHSAAHECAPNDQSTFTASMSPPHHISQPEIENRKFSLARPQPTEEALKHFVKVYETKIHLQPLPLFTLDRLEEQLLTGPHFLLWSFMALTLTLSTHPFYDGQRTIARDLYTRKAEEAVNVLASEGDISPEVTLSLCLTALKHLNDQQLARAWMTIGTAARLQALRVLSINNAPSSTDDSISRAHWSVFMLERLFVPTMPEAFGPGIPEFPISAPKPLAPQSTLLTTIPERAQAEPRTLLSSDPGIIGVHMRLVSIWGKLRFYLHGLKRGITEKPWSPDSTHTKLNIEMIEHEALIDSSYFLSKAFLPSRTKAEISSHREYWDPFMASQIIWHAIHAVLNHPFVHLFLLRSSRDVPPSCLFLQQRIDMALFHTGSLFRILQSFMDLMDIVDPMVAEFVAAAATVSWFFQFSADPKISRRAREELDKCDPFLSHVAETWPHVKQKLETLRKLEALANENRRQHSDEGTTIRFQSAWLWELLNPKIPSAQIGSSHSGSGPGGASEKNPDSEMYLKSHFVMPLQDDQDSSQTREAVTSDQDGMDSLFTMPGDLDLFNIELLSHDFFENGLWDQGC